MRAVVLSRGRAGSTGGIADTGRLLAAIIVAFPLACAARYAARSNIKLAEQLAQQPSCWKLASGRQYLKLAA